MTGIARRKWHEMCICDGLHDFDDEVTVRTHTEMSANTMPTSPVCASTQYLGMCVIRTKNNLHFQSSSIISVIAPEASTAAAAATPALTLDNSAPAVMLKNNWHQNCMCANTRHNVHEIQSPMRLAYHTKPKFCNCVCVGVGISE